MVGGIYIYSLSIMCSHKVIDFFRSSSTRRKKQADYKEDSDVSLERQRVVTGDARKDLLVFHNLTKVRILIYTQNRTVTSVTLHDIRPLRPLSLEIHQGLVNMSYI